MSSGIGSVIHLTLFAACRAHSAEAAWVWPSYSRHWSHGPDAHHGQVTITFTLRTDGSSGLMNVHITLCYCRIEGRTLWDVPLTPAIGKAAQSSLAITHARGVALGDVHLRNMMLVAGTPPDNPKVVLIDFGKAVINASPYHIFQDVFQLSQDFADKVSFDSAHLL